MSAIKIKATWEEFWNGKWAEYDSEVYEATETEKSFIVVWGKGQFKKLLPKFYKHTYNPGKLNTKWLYQYAFSSKKNNVVSKRIVFTLLPNDGLSDEDIKQRGSQAVEYLDKCGFHSVVVTLKIGNEFFVGAKYLSHEHQTPRILVIGTTPNDHNLNAHVAFIINGNDWFITHGFHSQKQFNEIGPEYKKKHELGPTFGLSLWNEDHGKIDDSYYVKGEKRSYKRIPVEVTEI